MEKEEFFLKRIRELANIAYQRDIVTFTDFLNLNEQNILNTQNRKGLGVCVGTFGGWEAAERQMAAFYPQRLPWGDFEPWRGQERCRRYSHTGKRSLALL